MRIAYDELVPEGEEVACVGLAPSLHDARRMKAILEDEHLDFAIEVEPHASFEVTGSHEHARAAFFVAACDASHALSALRSDHAEAAPQHAP
ncbi:hypothetical protein [Anaeromyxobacter diazotrophicus]|uniref:Uncharacterized protein n=1 Tax=Anaeromyxobacter diazotrophicus TaxID=2590199 RepID=A0A7I9VQ07_9BACT|nr:hypothetical protein [Anaeromyxobacter diazotrophicus]GEJ58492.1 hypothetical protein AMYX_32330 [Anaeromyxobacter diazotrophicus]